MAHNLSYGMFWIKKSPVGYNPAGLFMLKDNICTHQAIPLPVGYNSTHNSNPSLGYSVWTVAWILRAYFCVLD